MGIKAFITGVAGTALREEERRFLDAEHPWGLIVFARNIEDRSQLRKLVDEFREIVGRGDAPVLIDQEGGRVQRMKPPHWPQYVTGRALGDVWRRDRKAGETAIHLHSRLIAHDLKECGINVDCLPVLDVPVQGAHDVIGDRAYAFDAQTIADVAQIACRGLYDGGVLPVIKHIPGHGRAFADSHLELPVVDASHESLALSDFLPFKALSGEPMAMTAHILYRALDPNQPATLSKHIIETIIRGEIGFDGLLMTDDLSMQALGGALWQRAEAALEAGCDMLLHCNGKFDEMEEVASVCPVLEEELLRRAENALARLDAPLEFDVDAARQEYSALLEALV